MTDEPTIEERRKLVEGDPDQTADEDNDDQADDETEQEPQAT